jgi:hypothetical protein
MKETDADEKKVKSAVTQLLNTESKRTNNQ